MSKVKIQGNASGTGVVTLTAPNTNTDRTITLPDGAGELLAKDSSGRVGIGTSTLNSNKAVIEGGVAGSHSSTLALKTGSGANSKVADLAFYSTFVLPTDDQGQRRTADITSGFSTDAWGTEYLAFGVGGASDAANVTSEKMRILSSGGISFNGDTAAANALDDYEEGTFIPTMIINADSTGITYGYSFGTYTKIGRKVTVNIRITLTNKGTNTGQVKIGGLPFAIGNNLNSTGYESAVNIYTWNSLATNVYHLGGTAVESSSRLHLFGNNAASGDVHDLPGTYLTNTTTFRMSCTYFT